MAFGSISLVGASQWPGLISTCGRQLFLDKIRVSSWSCDASGHHLTTFPARKIWRSRIQLLLVVCLIAVCSCSNNLTRRELDGQWGRSNQLRTLLRRYHTPSPALKTRLTLYPFSTDYLRQFSPRKMMRFKSASGTVQSVFGPQILLKTYSTIGKIDGFSSVLESSHLLPTCSQRQLISHSTRGTFDQLATK